MRLELGSGQRPTEGYTHLDIRPDWPDVDIVDNAAVLEKIPLGSCDEIRACHLLEHFGHQETVWVLKVWRCRLKPGGTLYVEVPSLEGHVAAWMRRDVSDSQFVHYLYGDQDYPENTHRTGFTKTSLKAALSAAGFNGCTLMDYGLVIAAVTQR